MKEKGVSRNIGGAGKRLLGEAPGVGVFSKAGEATTPQAALSLEPPAKGERRRRKVLDDSRYFKELDEKRMKSALMLWTMLLGIGGLVVIVLFVVFWLRPYITERDRMATTSSKIDQYIPMDEMIDTKALGETKALLLAKKAMAARTDEEILAVIDPGSEPIARVREFLENLPVRDGGITHYSLIPRLDTSREDVTGVVVSFAKGESQRNRIALFASAGGDEWRMDFPAFARLVAPSWDELLNGAAERAVVRVYVAEDQYFNGPFNEADGWICYGVASPDVERLLLGYCKEDSDQGRALKELLRSKKMARATVVLERYPEADGRQFLIKRILAEDWLIGDEAADEAGR